MALVTKWTLDGYIRWLHRLGTQYKRRRDFFLDCLAEEFELLPGAAPDGPGTLLCAYPRGGRGNSRDDSETATTMQPLLSFVPPSSGMFVWVKLHFGDVPDKRDESDGSLLTPERQFWRRLAETGLLVAPGWYFLPETHTLLGATPPTETDRKIGHMRLSYTPADVSAGVFHRLYGLTRDVQMEATRLGMKFFAQTLRDFCRV